MSRLVRWTIIRAVVAVLLTAMLCLAIAPSTASPAQAADPVVAIDPASAEVPLGGTVDVDIVISDIPDTGLWAASVDLTFDASVLEVVDADGIHAGVQLFTGTFPCPSQGPCNVSENSVDNVAGTIGYDVTLDDPSTPVGGTGTLATIRFRGKAGGTASVAFQAAVLWGPGPTDNMTSTTAAGEVVVSQATDTPEPTPTAAATATRTPSATGTPRATNTPDPTHTPRATNTPKNTNTPRPTATPKPPKGEPESTKQAAAGAGSSQPTPSGGALPSAGTGEMPNQVWRWFFLSGAVIMGLATWAFTFRFYARQKESERFWHR